jgi:Ca2+-binding RTX toxin-like protein
MSSKMVVLFFGVQFGILIILVGILTPYSGVAAVIKFHSDSDKNRAGIEDADQMLGTLGVNFTSVGNVYFIDGGDGADLLSGGQAENRINGGEGSDHLLGGFNSDFISGGNGEDYIDGGSGNDKIIGGAYEDILIGFEGDDLISSNDENRTKSDGYKDSVDCGPGDDEAWINVSNDGDLARNCESLHAG